MNRQETYVATIARDDDGRIQRISIDASDLDGTDRQVHVNGHRAARIAGAFHDILRAGGIPGRTWAGTAPIPLDQITGAHAALLLEAVRPVQRGDRLDRLSDGIANMSREEAAYWHAKSGRTGGLPALRVLLAWDGCR